MIEPWNIKSDDTRNADSLPTFIIFCEDEVSEPIYFKFFETSLIKVNPVERQKSKIENVINAITHCINEELMDLSGPTPVIKRDDIHVWCVFDRDKEETEDKISKGNVSFNESIETAKSRGIKVAWSNDAFELWLLLHFEDVDHTDAKYKERETYYNRLTEIFKGLANPNEDLIKALRHASFNYKQDLKQKNNFRNIVRKEIVDKTYQAIQRAKVLEEYHASVSTQNHLKTPATLIHHLVEELLFFGKKEI